MKIKVLQLIKSLGRGGAEMLLPASLQLHNRQHFEFHYGYFLNYKNQVVPDIERQNAVVTCFDSSGNWDIILSAPKVLNYVERHKIDIIHCHLPMAGFVGRYIHKRTGIPVVYTEHNNVSRYNPITKFINARTFNWQNHALAVSQDAYEAIMRTIKPKIPLEILLNGVNTQVFKRSGPIEQKKTIVVTVAVFRPQKRLDRWVEVVRKVVEKDPQFHFYLVGEGLERPMIEGLIKKYHLEEFVTMTGLVEDPKPFYNQAHYFLMTSDFEGLPVSLLEAMSMQCVPVCTEVGGINEVVRSDDNGYVVPVNGNEVEELSNTLITNKNGLEKVGERARETVQEHFNMQLMVNRLEKIYLNLSNEL